MDEENYQASLRSITERVSRIEKELVELRLLLLTQVPRLERTVDISFSNLSHPYKSEGTVPGHWEITCLGRFHHRCSGHDVVPCSSRRGHAILKYLLASPGYAASTDRLIECFWPRMDSVAGSHNLQVAVHALRRSLHGCGPDGNDETVLFYNNRYLLNPSLSIVQDVDHFRAAYERGQCANEAGRSQEAIQALEEARTYYSGSYLADPYEEWASSSRLALQDMQLTLLNQLGAFYSQVGRWEIAISCYRDILAIDSYREDVYRQLMRCYAECGRPADIKQIYSICRKCLIRDLHLAPASETTALYQQLIQHSSSQSVH